MLVRLLFLVATVLAMPTASAASDDMAVAFAARTVGNEMRTRLIVDLDKSVGHEVYLLDGPPRLLIDLERTLFEMPPLDALPPKSAVKAVRYGQISKERSRMVLDLAGPVRVETATLRPLGGSLARHRLIVDLLPSDVQSFQASVRQDAEPAPTPEPPVRDEEQRKFRVMLDAGHGGIDGGASGQGRLREKGITLDFTKQLKSALEATGRIEVLMTREDDSFVSLRERLAKVRAAHPDLLISIHADSLRQRAIRGATIYTLSKKASDALSHQLADKQNGADLVAGLELPETEGDATDILVDLTRRETERFSIAFANALLDHMRGNVHLIGNPLRAANFYVLKAPDVPSVLLELGYLSNESDERLLRDPTWVRSTVEVITSAILGFFEPRMAEGG